MGIQKQFYKFSIAAFIALSIAVTSFVAHAYKRYEVTFPNGTTYTETYDDVPYQQSVITGTPLYLGVPIRRTPIRTTVPQGNTALITPSYQYYNHPYGRSVSPYRYQNLQTQRRFSGGGFMGNPAQGMLQQNTQTQSDSFGGNTQTRTNVTIFGQQ